MTDKTPPFRLSFPLPPSSPPESPPPGGPADTPQERTPLLAVAEEYIEAHPFAALMGAAIAEHVPELFARWREARAQRAPSRD